MRITIYTDGGSRGNPGPAASAFVVYGDNGEILHKSSHYLGVATNNQAEYDAVLQAFIWLTSAASISNPIVSFVIDSELVVRQLTGVYKIKNLDLLAIVQQIKKYEHQCRSVSYTHVLRNKNQMADSLVNECLDLHQA